jgi:hypothetical protein
VQAPNTSDERLLKAVRAIKLQDYAAASRLLGDVILKDPSSFVALDLAAFCALHTGNYQLALSTAIQCTALKPAWCAPPAARRPPPAARRRLGSAVVGARARVNQCVLLRCRSRGWARLGAAQLCLGHHRAAVSAYQRGLDLEAGSQELQMGLQLAQRAAGGRDPQRRAAMHDD